MKKAIIIDAADLEKFSDIRESIVSMCATLELYRRGSLSLNVAFGRIAHELPKAEEAVRAFSKGGI
jgi:hypothetical protein